MKEGISHIPNPESEVIKKVHEVLGYNMPEDIRTQLRWGQEDQTDEERKLLQQINIFKSRKGKLKKQLELFNEASTKPEVNTSGTLRRIRSSVDAIEKQHKELGFALSQLPVRSEEKEAATAEDFGDLSEVIESQNTEADALTMNSSEDYEVDDVEKQLLQTLMDTDPKDVTNENASEIDISVASEPVTSEENRVDLMSPEDELREKMKQVAAMKGREKAERENTVTDSEVDVTETTKNEVEQTVSEEQSGSQSDSVATVETSEQKELSSYYKKLSDLELLGTKEYMHAQPEYQNILNAIKKLESLAKRKSENAEVDAYVESASTEHLDNLLKRLSDRVGERRAGFEDSFGSDMVDGFHIETQPESEPEKTKRTGWWNRSHPTFEKSDAKKGSTVEGSQAQAIIDQLTSDATEIDRAQLVALKDEIISAAGTDKNKN